MYGNLEVGVFEAKNDTSASFPIAFQREIYASVLNDIKSVVV